MARTLTGENARRGETRTPRVGFFGFALAGTPNIRLLAITIPRMLVMDLRFKKYLPRYDK